jgi:hypothetical protein
VARRLIVRSVQWGVPVEGARGWNRGAVDPRSSYPEATRRYSMADSAHVAKEFFHAWTIDDCGRARTLLKDDLHFEAPIDTFDDADSYLNSRRGLTRMMTGLEKLKVFVAQGH